MGDSRSGQMLQGRRFGIQKGSGLWLYVRRALRLQGRPLLRPRNKVVELVLRAGTDRRTRLSAQLRAPDLIQVLVDVLVSLDAIVFVCRLAGTL